jgi:microsomal dipeptidase-like Zn-dependent dipeptidase
MIKRVVDVAGVDHVGIGTDSDLEPGVQRTYTNAIWAGETRGFFPAVAAGMLAAGLCQRKSPSSVGATSAAFLAKSLIDQFGCQCCEPSIYL